MPQINLASFGYNEVVTQSTATKTLALTDSGLVYNTTVSCVYTLPATAAGLTFLIRVGAEGITVALSPQAADYVGGAGLTNVDNKDLLLTNAPAGSFVQVVGDGVNGYYIQNINTGGVSSAISKEA